MSQTHNEMVYAFLNQCEQADPSGYAKLASRYPILSANRTRRLRRRETCVGLLGLQPCQIDADVAYRHGFEVPFPEDD